MIENEKIILNASAAVLSAQATPHTYLCRFVRAGRINSGAGKQADIEITTQALADAVARGLFEGRAVFVDHAGFFEYPSLRDLVGVSSNAVSIDHGQEVNGQIRLYDTPQAHRLLIYWRNFSTIVRRVMLCQILDCRLCSIRFGMKPKNQAVCGEWWGLNKSNRLIWFSNRLRMDVYYKVYPGKPT